MGHTACVCVTVIATSTAKHCFRNKFCVGRAMDFPFHTSQHREGSHQHAVHSVAARFDFFRPRSSASKSGTGFTIFIDACCCNKAANVPISR